jgi:hypothetical protein
MDVSTSCTFTKEIPETSVPFHNSEDQSMKYNFYGNSDPTVRLKTYENKSVAEEEGGLFQSVIYGLREDGNERLTKVLQLYSVFYTSRIIIKRTVCVQDRGKWRDVVEKAKTFNIWSCNA